MSTDQVVVFAALADPTRLSIVDLLAQRGELSAGDIGRVFTSSASAVSQHLKVLREAGLVLVQKRAQQRIYRLDPATIVAAEQWLAGRTRQWNSRLDAMETYIEHLTEGESHAR
ncbi:ArsR/SmtB family transcription factor [Leifsonia poae]|uniref:ArsR/SmtB family transcription factor n=1 Tax=Leifsonia poae TaxID=110933 RepID=UPI001CBBB781|nr:metalloregulator ArsR/SmtB family transcription factor [Leifsonia poae]